MDPAASVGLGARLEVVGILPARGGVYLLLAYYHHGYTYYYWVEVVLSYIDAW